MSEPLAVRSPYGRTEQDLVQHLQAFHRVDAADWDLDAARKFHGQDHRSYEESAEAAPYKTHTHPGWL